MAKSDALWNEVAWIINTEFFEYEQPITGAMLIQVVKYVSEMLDESSS